MSRHCTKALRTAMSASTPRVELISMLAMERLLARRISALSMLEKLESISWEPLWAVPVASISPFLKALKSAWESICL